MDGQALETDSAVAVSSLLGQACDSGGLVASADASSLPRDLVGADRGGSFFALPLLSEGRCIGWLTGRQAHERFALEEMESDVLKTVGVLLATLIEKELLHERLRQPDEAKTQFLALASHELRTPVQTVYGILSTLHLRGTPLEEHQLVELRSVAYEQSERLRRLVEP